MEGGPTRAPHPPEKVRELVHLFLEEGSLLLPGHFRERMQQRCFDLQDVVHVLLRSGDYRSKAPEWNPEFAQYRYTVVGDDLAGDPLTLVLAFDESRMVLVTGF